MNTSDRFYARLYGGFTFNRKVMAVGNAAAGAYARMLAWVAQNKTDGVVPFNIVPVICSPEEQRQLLAAGLLDGLYMGECRIHDYLDHNPDSAYLDSVQQQRVAAGRKGVEARKKQPYGQPSAQPNGQPSALYLSLDSTEENTTGDVVPDKLTSEQRYAHAYAEGQELAVPGCAYPDPTEHTQLGAINRFTQQAGWGKGLRGEALLQAIRDVSRAYRRAMTNDAFHANAGFPPMLCMRWASGNAWKPKRPTLPTSGQEVPTKPAEKMDPKEYHRKMQALVDQLDSVDASDVAGGTK